MNNEQQEQESRAIIPIVQDTIIFNGKPLVVVRLPDGRPGVVLRWICENLNLGPQAQVDRIKRTEVIADDLVYVRVQTDGGPQVMPTLVLSSAPYWLATIETRRMQKDDPKRLEILTYQRKAVAALYEWAQSLKTPAKATDLVPAEQIIRPQAPADDAALEERREYHRQMVLWLDWQRDIESWQGTVESRLEGLEAVTDLIPEILERLGPQTLTAEQQRSVQTYAKQLHDATGKSFGTIYDDLKTAFNVPKYADIPEAEWNKVVNWFKVQLNQKRRR